MNARRHRRHRENIDNYRLPAILAYPPSSAYSAILAILAYSAIVNAIPNVIRGNIVDFATPAPPHHTIRQISYLEYGISILARLYQR